MTEPAILSCDVTYEVEVSPGFGILALPGKYEPVTLQHREGDQQIKARVWPVVRRRGPQKLPCLVSLRATFTSRDYPIDKSVWDSAAKRLELVLRERLFGDEPAPPPETWSLHLRLNFLLMQERHDMAKAVFGQVLRSLRHEYDEIRIDVRAESASEIELTRIDGTKVARGSMKLSRFIFDLFEIFTPDTWDSVIERIIQRSAAIEVEWSMEARYFLESQGDYGMAVIAAATSAEVAAFTLVRRNLIRTGRVSSRQADRLLDGMSRRNDLPALLRLFDIVTDEQIDQITSTFVLRNEIVHGRRRKPVSRSEAARAIGSATLLSDALSQDREINGGARLQRTPPEGSTQE